VVQLVVAIVLWAKKKKKKKVLRVSRGESCR
jgi:hypothetical protein